MQDTRVDSILHFDGENTGGIFGVIISENRISIRISDLSDRANGDRECWPAIPTIAEEIKLSEATVRRAIKDLKNAGVIETEQRYRSKGGKSSLLYRMKI